MRSFYLPLLTPSMLRFKATQKREKLEGIELENSRTEGRARTDQLCYPYSRVRVSRAEGFTRAALGAVFNYLEI